MDQVLGELGFADGKNLAQAHDLHAMRVLLQSKILLLSCFFCEDVS